MMANQEKKIEAKRSIVYSTSENPVLTPSLIGTRNISKYTKRHLAFEGKSIKIVEDGICDIDAEIMSELKNAGLQNILKLQELRYGTLENAITRANDRGVYADVSKIPDSIGERAEFIAKARADLEALKAKYNLTDEDIKNFNIDSFAAKLNPTPQASPQTLEGDAK